MKRQLTRLTLMFALGAVLFGAKRGLSAEAPARAVVRVHVADDEDREHAIDRALLAQTALDRGLARQDPVVQARLGAMFPELRERASELGAARLQRELFQRAQALHLFTEDALLRSRLASDAELALAADVMVAEPSEAELLHFYTQQRERYSRAVRVSFTQLLVTRDKHGEAAATVAEGLRAELIGKAIAPREAGGYGEPSNLPRHWQDATLASVRTRFGDDVASALAELAEGTWSAPVASSLGQHLLWVDARAAASVAPFPEVRERVRTDLLAQLRKRTLQEQVRLLRSQYVVEVER